MAKQPLHLLRQFWKLWRGLDHYSTTPETTAPAKDVAVAKGNSMLAINQWVRIGAYEIKVNEVVDRTLENYRLALKTRRNMPPIIVLDDGKELMPPMGPDEPQFLFVDVSYRNPTVNENLDCRRNQWWLYDEEGFSYETLYNERFYRANQKRYLGGSRYLSPNTSLRGWVAFELPQTAVPQRLQFVDGFLRGNTVDFSLPVSRDP